MHDSRFGSWPLGFRGIESSFLTLSPGSARSNSAQPPFRGLSYSLKPPTLGFFPPMSPKRACPHHVHGPLLGITRPGEAPAPAGTHTRIIFSQSPVRLEMGGVRHLLAGLCSCHCAHTCQQLEYNTVINIKSLY